MSDVTIVEIELYRPGAGAGARYARGIRPLGLPPAGAPLEATATLRASDTGYRTRNTDPGGVAAYPPTLDSALEIQEALNLEPGNSAVAWSAGSVQLLNPTGEYDQTEGFFNADRRVVRIRRGRRAQDAARGIEVDPAYSGLATLFTGLGQPWVAGENLLTLPIRDASYWTEQPLLTGLYAGTGGYQGTVDLEGQPIPKLRGGRVGNPVLNVKPVLVDRSIGLYQVSDGPGLIAAVYDAGDAWTDRAADTTDPYGSVPPAGHWRSCSLPTGLYVQTGTPLQEGRELTCDAVGDFPVAGPMTYAANLVRYLLTEDAGLPLSLLDVPSFTAAIAEAPFYTGDFWTDPVQVVEAIAPILASIGAQLVPTPEGKLALVLLRAVPADAVPAARLTAGQMLAAPRPVGLPTSLAPSPWRWRIGHSRNNTVQASNTLDPDVTDARRAFLAQTDQVALAWQDTALLQAYRVPNDPAVVSTRLLTKADATEVGQAFGELWGKDRRLFEIPLDIDDALSLPLGTIVHVDYPIRSLRNGTLCRIVRRNISLKSRTITLTVLV
ncbi:hypothetical protein [Roseomonas sp. USHLN139]|uniref:hypothetical protein n=1 Tax=Roseomonas sp. USHLN139 TaxID=3081298 RepID=UPI003B029BE0